MIFINIITIFSGIITINNKNNKILEVTQQMQREKEFYEDARTYIDSLQYVHDLTKDSLEAYKETEMYSPNKPNYEPDYQQINYEEPKVIEKVVKKYIRDTVYIETPINTNIAILDTSTVGKPKLFNENYLLYYDNEMIVRRYQDTIYINTNQGLHKIYERTP